MRIRISLNVKFRVLGFTLWTHKAAWFVLLDEGGSFRIHPIDPQSEPVDAHELLDQRGVRLAVW